MSGQGTAPADGPAEFPTLETARLILREVTMDDVPAFRAFLSIPEVTRFTNWPDGPTEEEGASIVRTSVSLFPEGLGCAWFIEDRSSGEFMGAIRFSYCVKEWCTAGVGYELDPAFWGRGFMAEALTAVMRCAHGRFGVNRMEAWTLPGNGASDRVLQKVGFLYEGTQRQNARFKGRFHDSRIFARVADDPMPA